MKKKTQSFKFIHYGATYDLRPGDSFASCCGARFRKDVVYNSGWGIEMFPESYTFTGILKENESHYKVPTRNGVIQFVVRDKK